MPLVVSAYAATLRWCVVTIVDTLLPARSSRIALASAEPSSASVLVPSSSRSTSDSGVACARMSITLRICELKVDTDCSILCWSPTSAYTPSNTGRTLPSFAGICNPAWCISASKPTFFIATVLPPVFGPVTTSTDQSGPTLTLTGTASLPSSGWRALMRRTAISLAKLCPPSASDRTTFAKSASAGDRGLTPRME